MFLAYNRKLPNNLQILYVRNISEYGLRNPHYFKKVKVNCCIKKMCMSVYGVDLLQKHLPLVENNNLYTFKKKYKNRLLDNYN